MTARASASTHVLICSECGAQISGWLLNGQRSPVVLQPCGHAAPVTAKPLMQLRQEPDAA